MVYWTMIRQDRPLFSTHENESYRAKYGFKELHVHNAPERRNKDFKPALYGHFRGMLNFKHSQPWAIGRHLKDMFEEDHHIPIRYIKEAIRGAFVGLFGGLMVTSHTGFNIFAFKKLYLQANQQPYGWKHFTIAKGLYEKPAGMGAVIFVSYQLLWDLFTRHREALGVPDYITHMKIGAIMCPLFTTYMFGPSYAFAGFAFVWPLIFAFKKMLRHQGPHYSHVYYIDGVTQAEKDKFEYSDYIEEISVIMPLHYGNHTNWFDGRNASV